MAFFCGYSLFFTAGFLGHDACYDTRYTPFWPFFAGMASFLPPGSWVTTLATIQGIPLFGHFLRVWPLFYRRVLGSRRLLHDRSILYSLFFAAGFLGYDACYDTGIPLFGPFFAGIAYFLLPGSSVTTLATRYRYTPFWPFFAGIASFFPSGFLGRDDCHE